MKKVCKKAISLVLTLSLLLGLMSGLAVQAGASGSTGPQVSGLSTAGSYTLTPMYEQNGTFKEIDPVDEVYTGVNCFKLTFTGTAGAQYAVLLLNGDKAYPTESNLRFIDQDAFADGKAEFIVYPDAMPAGTYRLYVTGGDATLDLDKPAATFVVESLIPEVDNKTGTTPTATYSFSADGKTLTVCNELACVVLVEKPNGTYERLTATENKAAGGYDFNVSTVASGEKIVIAVKGDVDLNGNVDTTDITFIRKALLAESSNFYVKLDGLAEITADVNTDGNFDTTDITFIRKSLLAESNQFFAALKW